jgi:hypothetical protein
MNTELADQLREGMARVPARVPEGLARTAYRRSRRHRAAVRAAAAASTAAIAGTAAVVTLSGPAAPAAQTAAYVVSRMTQAIDANPGFVVFDRDTFHPANAALPPRDRWITLGRNRTETFTQAGGIATDVGYFKNAAGYMVVTSVDFQKKTWWRETGTHSVKPGPVPTPSLSCKDVSPFKMIFIPAQMADNLREEVSCGQLKLDGTGYVDGTPALKLTGGFPGFLPVTYWLNASTYLPVRVTIAGGNRSPGHQSDLQWLPPTAANLAKTTVTIPAGFKRVPPTSPTD